MIHPAPHPFYKNARGWLAGWLAVVNQLLLLDNEERLEMCVKSLLLLLLLLLWSWLALVPPSF
jgi:hypothetical protein